MNLSQVAHFIESDDSYVKDVYDIINKAGVQETIAGDSTPLIRLRANEIDEIAQVGYEHVQANYLSHGMAFQSSQEVRNEICLKIAGDSLINAKTGVGTMVDPAIYTHSQIPVMMGPHEGSAVYASGGLPATIIDKKARAMVMQGATFKSLDKFAYDVFIPFACFIITVTP